VLRKDKYRGRVRYLLEVLLVSLPLDGNNLVNLVKAVRTSRKDRRRTINANLPKRAHRHPTNLIHKHKANLVLKVKRKDKRTKVHHKHRSVVHLKHPIRHTRHTCPNKDIRCLVLNIPLWDRIRNILNYNMDNILSSDNIHNIHNMFNTDSILNIPNSLSTVKCRIKGPRA
jgi:hypothetical protein